MTIVRDDALERDPTVDRMFSEFRAAQLRRAANRSERDRDALPADPRPTDQVPAEYLSLYAYLEHRRESAVVLTFEQLEAVLGFALPASARTEPDWWGAPALQCLSHSSAWAETGRIAAPNLSSRTVTFERR
jgi:hypothetical protein